ncbi:glycosyltransferase family 4 protein [Ornithinimicrobium ciconiae]|uniref:D-inositol 3-phosphate glycosyltransferase n=1 Tax=Ornithinimicrobium ciconiae TaxID=2594265 RepID=A0A516GB87_9MICO|nr:glycosyltransferase family 4 protein [Ornithinimicrobium ciconiae]QDO88779.1 glycosyltransferase family 4 protein [Ornithinimicrobium ciconiae]
MRPTLLVTNDFPPRHGGIQSYLHNFAATLPPQDLTVFTSSYHKADMASFDAAQPYEVLRSSHTVMVPTPDVVRRAAEIVRSHQIETVWFGAAAPLALMAPALRRAGARRIISSTHGHEVGWWMTPGARQALRRIGNNTDVMTYVSQYTRRRLAKAFAGAGQLANLPSGVDADAFRPDPGARARLRERYGLGERPVILCLSRLVARKGADMLIRAMPQIRHEVPGAVLVIAGEGSYEKTLRKLVAEHGVGDDVLFTGRVPSDEIAAHYAMPDLFAMPCRTRGKGLDVEGLGVVYLEAAAAGVPVIAGTSGGAPETVLDGQTGLVVDGRDVDGLGAAVVSILGDPERAQQMGAAGRQWAQEHWGWDTLGARLRSLIDGA